MDPWERQQKANGKYRWDIADHEQLVELLDENIFEWPEWYKRLAMAIMYDAVRDYQAGLGNLPRTTHYKDHTARAKQAKKWFMSTVSDYIFSFEFIANNVLKTSPRRLRMQILSNKAKLFIGKNITGKREVA